MLRLSLRKMTTLVFGSKDAKAAHSYVFVGEKSLLKDTALYAPYLPASANVSALLAPLTHDLGAASTEGAKGGSSASSHFSHENVLKHVAIQTIPATRSRHNAYVRVDSIQDAMKAVKDVDAQVVVALNSADHAFAAVSPSILWIY